MPLKAREAAVRLGISYTTLKKWISLEMAGQFLVRHRTQGPRIDTTCQPARCRNRHLTPIRTRSASLTRHKCDNFYPILRGLLCLCGTKQFTHRADKSCQFLFRHLHLGVIEMSCCLIHLRLLILRALRSFIESCPKICLVFEIRVIFPPCYFGSIRFWSS